MHVFLKRRLNQVLFCTCVLHSLKMHSQLPQRGRRLISHELMRQIMLVCHVAKRAQVKIKAFTTLPAHALYAPLLAVVTNDVRMPNANGGVVEYAQIVLVLVAHTVVGTRARIPLHDHSLFGRRLAAQFAHFGDGATMAFAIVLVPPLPVGTTDNSNSYLHQQQQQQQQQQFKAKPFFFVFYSKNDHCEFRIYLECTESSCIFE